MQPSPLDPRWIHNSPVSCLNGNIAARFEAAIPVELLRRDVDAGIVNPAIEVEMAAMPPRTPYADGSPASIFVGLSYLEGLWAAAYGLFVRQEHEMRLATREWEHREPEGTEFLPDTVVRADALLSWARSLRDAYTPWPNGLPSPLYHASSEESEIAGKVNTIFIDAAAFLFHHELAHAQYGHVAVGSDEEKLQWEKEADIVAFSRFFDHTTSLHKLKLIGWAMVLPLIYGLDLLKHPQGLFADRHLHTHHRLEHVLAHLNFGDPFLEDYFGTVCADAVRTFCIRHGIDPGLQGPKFDRVNDVLQHMINYLDRFDPSVPPP